MLPQNNFVAIISIYYPQETVYEYEIFAKSLDECLNCYNNVRYHQGKICSGKANVYLLSGKLIEYEKNLNQI